MRKRSETPGELEPGPAPETPPPADPKEPRRRPYPVEEPGIDDLPGIDPDYVPGRNPEPGKI